MLNVRLAGAIGLVIAATATPALADSAFISLGAGTNGWTYWSNDSYRDGGAIELAASGVYQFTPELGVQGDLILGSHQNKIDSYEMSSTEANAALHAFFRNEAYLIGGFAQLGKTITDPNSGDSSHWTAIYGGAEAQLYIDNVTLYGKVGVSATGVDDSEWGELSSVFAEAKIRYFVTDNLRLDAYVGLDSAKIDDYSVKLTTAKIGAGIEYKFDNSPISAFGQVDYYSSEDHGHGGIDGYRLLVGLKFNFGDDTLKARDRSGPSLDTVLPLNVFAGRG